MGRSEPDISAPAAEPTDPGSREWLDGLTALSRALGTDRFRHRLLELLNRVLPVDHCVVFTCAPDAGAAHLFTHGRMPPARAQHLAAEYVDRFQGRDPMLTRIAAGEVSEEEVLMPLELEHQDYDPAYRNYFFDRNDLVDKASTIGRVEHDTVYCNFYRMGASGRYSARDWYQLERILPLLTSLIANHYRVLRLEDRQGGATESVPSLVHTIIGQRVPPFDRLTRREREVCERILLGYTAVGIGLDLAIAPSSVITYRRRAYAKLGIGSQRELFSLCLSAARRVRGTGARASP